LVDSTTGKFAHTAVTNQISMGALLMQNFVFHGQITGLHESFINSSNSNKGFDDELCLRKFINNPNKVYGELLSLEPKHSKSGSTGFTKTNGFSPDILDCLFQACNFAAMYRGMIPGYKDGSKITYQFDGGITQKNLFVEELELHEEDLIHAYEPKEEYNHNSPVDYLNEVEDLIEYV
jgi:hypothetical protein